MVHHSRFYPSLVVVKVLSPRERLEHHEHYDPIKVDISHVMIRKHPSVILVVIVDIHSTDFYLPINWLTSSMR